VTTQRSNKKRHLRPVTSVFQSEDLCSPLPLPNLPLLLDKGACNRKSPPSVVIPQLHYEQMRFVAFSSVIVQRNHLRSSSTCSPLSQGFVANSAVKSLTRRSESSSKVPSIPMFTTQRTDPFPSTPGDVQTGAGVWWWPGWTSPRSFPSPACYCCRC